MGPIATAMGEIYQYTLQGHQCPAEPGRRKRHLTDLRTLQEWVVTPLLKSVPGVNEINSFGGYFKQYQVMVDPAKLVAYNLTLDDVYGAIEKNNQNVGGNVLDRFDEQYIVRGVGLLKSEDDIRSIVLAARARHSRLRPRRCRRAGRRGRPAGGRAHERRRAKSSAAS